jgi:hypothetical protein
MPRGAALVWDFGSGAVRHRLYCDWLDPSSCQAGVLAMRGTIPPSFGLMRAHSEEIMALLQEAGCASTPVGVDVAETAMLFAPQEAGMQVGRRPADQARRPQDHAPDPRMIRARTTVLLGSLASNRARSSAETYDPSRRARIAHPPVLVR